MPAMHETNLDGRVAIITGSGQNIGAAIARRLAEAGAAVVVNGHTSRENVERTVSEIREAGGRAVGIMADVSDPKDVGRLVAEANAAFGRWTLPSRMSGGDCSSRSSRSASRIGTGQSGPTSHP